MLKLRPALLIALILTACDAAPDGGMDTAPAEDMTPGDSRPDDVAVVNDATPDVPLDGGIEADLGPDIGPPDASIVSDMQPDAPPPPPDGGMDATAIDAAPLDMAPVDAGPPDAQPDMGPPPPPREQCFGGIDDDGDGLIDCGDPDCRPSGACFDAREICDNGIDDDGDTRIDCDDRYCLGDDRCPAPDVVAFTTEELQRRFDFDCVHCHGPVDPFSSLDLSEPFEDAVVDVPSVQVLMSLVKSGDRADSFLYQKMVWHHLEFGGDGDGMPPAADNLPPWSAADAERLGLWIESLGAR